MIISAGSDPLPDGATTANEDSQKVRPATSGWRLFELLSVRSLLAIWAVLSLTWAGAVCYDLYHRAAVQAEMARDVEHDLDEGFATASCIGASCAAPRRTALESWSNIVSTYLKFGSREIGVYALGPPLTVLAVGMAAFMVLRRRSG